MLTVIFGCWLLHENVIAIAENDLL